MFCIWYWSSAMHLQKRYSINMNTEYVRTRAVSVSLDLLSHMTLELEYHLLHFDFEIDLKPVYWLPCTLCNLLNANETLNRCCVDFTWLRYHIYHVYECKRWNFVRKYLLDEFYIDFSCGSCHMAAAAAQLCSMLS